MIIFDKRFIKSILAGEKTVTRRMWKRQLVKPGSIQCFAYKWTNDGIFCKAKIVRVSRGELGDVDLREARKEGFDSVQAFRDFFGEKWNPDLAVWVIRFEVISSELTEF